MHLGRSSIIITFQIQESEYYIQYEARKIEDELRKTIKDGYGNKFNAAVANTAEAGMRVYLGFGCSVNYEKR